MLKVTTEISNNIKRVIGRKQSNLFLTIGQWYSGRPAEIIPLPQETDSGFQ